MLKGIIMAAIVASTACPPYSYEAGGNQVDKKVNVYVNIQPDLGWKWNSKYPAKYRLEFLDGKKTERYKFEDGKLKHILSALEPPVNNIKIIASFTLCSKTTCLTFRNKEFIIKF